MCFGKATTPGQGTCPSTSQMHWRLQPNPKLAGLSFFCTAFCSAAKTWLKQEQFTD